MFGLLDSLLLDFWLKRITSRFWGGPYAYNRQYTEQVPIHLADLSSPHEKALYDQVMVPIKQFLEIQMQLEFPQH